MGQLWRLVEQNPVYKQHDEENEQRQRPVDQERVLLIQPIRRVVDALRVLVHFLRLQDHLPGLLVDIVQVLQMGQILLVDRRGLLVGLLDLAVDPVQRVLLVNGFKLARARRGHSPRPRSPFGIQIKRYKSRRGGPRRAEVPS